MFTNPLDIKAKLERAREIALTVRGDTLMTDPQLAGAELLVIAGLIDEIMQSFSPEPQSGTSR